MNRFLNALLCLLTVSAASARAQTVDEFLDGAREHPSVDAAQSDVEVAESSARGARFALLPSLEVTGTYTRNQFPQAFTLPAPSGPGQEITVRARDQLDASFGSRLTLLDVIAWRRLAGTDAALDAAEAGAQVTLRRLERDVLTEFYRWVGGSALLGSSEDQLEVAQAAHRLMSVRMEAGLATPLDVERAALDVLVAEQLVLEARQTQLQAARALELLTGVRATSPPELEASTEPPEPIEGMLVDASQIPDVALAEASARAADAAAPPLWYAFVPRVDALFTEELTNAPAFGQRARWTLQIQAAWRIDLASLETLRANVASANAANARARATSLAAVDALGRAHLQVETALARTTTATARLALARRTFELARVELGAGRVTTLTFFQARRDYADAAANHISAVAELALARHLLRLAASAGSL